MKVLFTGITDPGLVRSTNQDNHYVDPEGRFFILADGMGGHAGGEQASCITTEIIKEYLNTNWDSPSQGHDLLEKAIHQANEGIIEDQMSHPERGDMGTTVVVIMFRNGKTWRAHVGDSRLYRLRNSQLEQITQDHTWIAQAIRSGEISEKDAKSHPWRHVLSQCLGRKDFYQGIDIETLEVQTGDLLLMCSDGLTEEVSEDIIAQSLERAPSLEKAAETLVEEAKNSGGSDNITIVIVGIS
jgi:protein phosphatase